MGGISKKLRLRRQMCEVHFGDDDIIIDGFRLNAVHRIGKTIKPNAEIDFYLDTGKDCYLLYLINNPKNTITLCKHNKFGNYLITIVVKKKLSNNILNELELIVHELKKIKIPKKIYEEIEFVGFE